MNFFFAGRLQSFTDALPQHDDRRTAVIRPHPRLVQSDGGYLVNW